MRKGKCTSEVKRKKEGRNLRSDTQRERRSEEWRSERRMIILKEGK